MNYTISIIDGCGNPSSYNPDPYCQVLISNLTQDRCEQLISIEWEQFEYPYGGNPDLSYNILVGNGPDTTVVANQALSVDHLEEITEEEFFASASDTSELIVEEPTNEGWKDEYQLAKDKFTKSVEKKDLFASAPIEVKKTTIQEDQIVTHLNQRKYYDRKGIVDHKRDISMVRPSRMDATKDMDTVKIRIGGKSVSMSRYLQNNLFGNQDGQNDTSSTSLLLERVLNFDVASTALEINSLKNIS